MQKVTTYEQKFIKDKVAKLPKIKPGMQVAVHQKIQEGDKERVQVFEGLVIKAKGTNELNYHITVRKTASGVGVEKVFPVHSPVIDKIEIVKKFKVRRADLAYVRHITKAKKLKEDREGFKKLEDAIEAVEAEEVKAAEEAKKAKEAEKAAAEEAKNKEEAEKKAEEAKEEKKEDAKAEEAPKAEVKKEEAAEAAKPEDK